MTNENSVASSRAAMTEYWRDLVYRIAQQPAKRADPDFDAAEALWQVHPRRLFLKRLPQDAKLLDIGAGSGALAFWRGGEPQRWDIQFYGTDLKEGEYSNLYKAWDVVNLDATMPSFPGVRFNGFLASHLIEHLERPEELIRYMASVADVGAEVYLEWPSPKTALFPTRDEFFNALGYKVSTLNFFDDTTHKATLEKDFVTAMLAKHGFQVLHGGEIDLGDIAIEAMARGRDRGSDMQTGLWYSTGWATYLQARKL